MRPSDLGLYTLGVRSLAKLKSISRRKTTTKASLICFNSSTTKAACFGSFLA